jgi:hypothetical protein
MQNYNQPLGMDLVHNKYSSIVPSEMSDSELRAMCGELHIATLFGKRYTRVIIKTSGMMYDVDTCQYKDYMQEYDNRLKLKQ